MTSIISNVVNVMLDGDPSPEEVRVAAEAARVTKDQALLARVAAMGELPEDVEASLNNDKSAKVLAARLSRPGVTFKEQLEAASDRRVSVATAVGSAHGLPQKLYRKVVENHSSASVLMTVAENVSVSLETRLNAVRKMSDIEHPNRTTSLKLASLCTSIPGAADELARKSGVKSELFTIAANSGYLSKDCIAELSSTVLDELRQDDKSLTPRWSYRDVVRSLGSLVAYAECPKGVVNAAAPFLTSNELTFVQRATHPLKHSKAEALLSVPDWSTVKSSEDLKPFIDLCVEGNVGLGRSLLKNPLISDEQFVYVAKNANLNYYGWNLNELVKVGTTPLRYAALLFNLPWSWSDETFERSSKPEEVVDHLVVWVSETQNLWYHFESLLRSRYFTTELGARLPTSLLARGSESIVVAQYVAKLLTEHFGHDPQAWVTALSFIPKVEGTVQEAFDTAVAVLQAEPVPAQ